MGVSRFRWRAGAVAALLVVAALGMSAQSAGAAERVFRSTLTAEQQDATGVPGDPGGRATSYIYMNSSSGLVCAYTSWSGIDSPVAFGHIHGGAAGEPENPAIIIDLFPGNPLGVSNPASGCTQAVPAVVGLIIACPKNFSTVLHSQQHPVAAVRGQVGTTCNQ